MAHSTPPFAPYCFAHGQKRVEGHGFRAPDTTESTSAVPTEPKSSDHIGEESAQSDAYLVAECLKGNEQAWDGLIKKYKRLVYSIPIKYGASSADAADILQSVYMELFCELSKLRRTESLKSWLMVVTARKCFQWHREKRLELALDNIEEQYPEAIAVSAPQFIEAEKEQFLREGIAQLSPRCRELVRLLFYEQPPLPYAEVAQRLGLAIGSIGLTRARCLERLQKVLSRMGF
jgi:RNA polymerase sigma factor (sigma-70 family)